MVGTRVQSCYFEFIAALIFLPNGTPDHRKFEFTDAFEEDKAVVTDVGQTLRERRLLRLDFKLCRAMFDETDRFNDAQLLYDRKSANIHARSRRPDLEDVLHSRLFHFKRKEKLFHITIDSIICESGGRTGILAQTIIDGFSFDNYCSWNSTDYRNPPNVLSTLLNRKRAL